MNTFQIFLTKLKKSYKLIFILSLILLFISCMGSILLGSVKIGFFDFIQTIFSNNTSSSSYSIIFHVRIPRTMAACFAGAALAVSGCILQTVMNNALASPSIIGINSGAALCAILVFIFFPYQYQLLPLAAFIGALSSALLVYFIALKTGASRISIILSGIAISTILGAALDLISIINPDSMVGATSFMIGGFTGITMSKLTYPIIYITLGIVLSLLFAKALNILALGDEIAYSLGLKVKRYRFIFLAIAALLAGSAVSFAGLLGFVGLLVPHIVRLFIGTNNKFLIPLVAIFGASFVTLCDLLVRMLCAPYEIPVGIMMSFLGGPFFIWLLITSKRGRFNV
ncbi:MAG: FecCD family ABC transporter permease [Turicibacter sp.]